MYGNELGNIIDSLFKGITILFVIAVPLAIWKVIDIIIWIIA